MPLPSHGGHRKEDGTHAVIRGSGDGAWRSTEWEQLHWQLGAYHGNLVLFVFEFFFFFLSRTKRKKKKRLLKIKPKTFSSDEFSQKPIIPHGSSKIREK